MAQIRRVVLLTKVRERLYSYYQDFGYNPHGLVAISESSYGWEATRARGAVAYRAVGNTWLAAEPLTSETDLETVGREFLEYARGQRCFAAFLPATDRFARVGMRMGLDCIPIGESPYFDLRQWTTEGRKLHTVRKELRKAREACVQVECVPGSELPRAEAEELQKAWVGTRRTTEFGWLFATDTFNFPDDKRHFLARSEAGRLIGLLSASPLPARRGYYFKDLNRHPEAPKGTSDLLIVHAMKRLREEGAWLATPGAVPLHGIWDDGVLRQGDFQWLMRGLDGLKNRGEAIYGFAGMYLFKSRFAPTYWEHEYILAPRGMLAWLRVGWAAARATAQHGIGKAILGGSWGRGL